MMSRPVLYGADYSVYTRIARLALAEKGVVYDFEVVDIFGHEMQPPAWYTELQPFRKIPALKHSDLLLYETQAIVRYVDAAFVGPVLTPDTPAGVGRMAQIISVADSYAYPWLVWGVLVPERKGTALTDDALDAAATCLAALESLLAEPFFLGESPTLADLQVAPMLIYLGLTPSGMTLLERHPRLRTWLHGMQRRGSVQATRYPAESS